MKICIATHHFLPRYASGVELYTYRLARWLLDNGHTVQVICVESIEEGELKPHCTEDMYETVPVHRLRFDLQAAPDPFRARYWNPAIGSWFKQFLESNQPDVVHINSLYLLSASVAMVAKELGAPIVLSLHDYWFQCPRITLLRPDGRICAIPDDPAACVWCLMTEKRRYRLPEIVSHGSAGRIAKRLLMHPEVARFLGCRPGIDAVRDRRRLLSDVLGQVDVVLVPTRFLRQKLVQQGCPLTKMVVSPYGLDVSYWEPLTKTAGNGLGVRIAYIGQVVSHKGIDTLIRAFKRLRGRAHRPELHIYGDMERFPEYAAKLRKLARGNARISFAGTYDNRQTPAVFSGIDVLVVPSVWYEGSPLVIAEALATKTPVIVSDLGGMAERIRNGVDGLVFRAGSVQDLTRKLQRLLDDPGMLLQLREGIRPVRTIDDEMDQLESIYQSLTAGKAIAR